MRIGIDVISIHRIERVLSSHGERFLQRFLSEDEILLADHKASRIAGFWAAKEACSKAVGTGIGKDLSFHDILISKDSRSAPLITLAESKLHLFHLSKFSLSITHDSGIAIAAVIAY